MLIRLFFLGLCVLSRFVVADGLPPGLYPNQVEATTIYSEVKVLAKGEKPNYQEFCDRAAQRMLPLIKHARVISYCCPDSEQAANGWVEPGAKAWRGTWRIGGKIHFSLLLEQPIQRVPVTFMVSVSNGSTDSGILYSMHYFEEAYEQEFNQMAERPDFVFLVWKGETKDEVKDDQVPAKAEAWLIR